MGGRKPRGGSSVRGSCSSACRVPHLRKMDATRDFSLFSGTLSFLGTTLSSSRDEHEAESIVYSENDTSLGAHEDHDDHELEDKLIKLESILDTMQQRIEFLESSLVQQQQTPALNMERFRTLEGRQASLQSKIATLDVAFGGASAAVWSRSCKKLREFLGVNDDKPLPTTSIMGVSRSFDSLLTAAITTNKGGETTVEEEGGQAKSKQKRRSVSGSNLAGNNNGGSSGIMTTSNDHNGVGKNVVPAAAVNGIQAVNSNPASKGSNSNELTNSSAAAVIVSVHHHEDAGCSQECKGSRRNSSDDDDGSVGGAATSSARGPVEMAGEGDGDGKGDGSGVDCGRGDVVRGDGRNDGSKYHEEDKRQVRDASTSTSTSTTNTAFSKTASSSTSSSRSITSDHPASKQPQSPHRPSTSSMPPSPHRSSVSTAISASSIPSSSSFNTRRHFSHGHNMSRHSSHNMTAQNAKNSTATGYGIMNNNNTSSSSDGYPYPYSNQHFISGYNVYAGYPPPPSTAGSISYGSPVGPMSPYASYYVYLPVATAHPPHPSHPPHPNTGR